METGDLILAERIASLEKSIYRKDIQFNFLMNLSTAISKKASEDSVFNMFRTFLKHEMGFNKMLFILRNADLWELKSALPDTMVNSDFDFTQYINAHLSEADIFKKVKHFADYVSVIKVTDSDEIIAFLLLGPNGYKFDPANDFSYISAICQIISTAINKHRLTVRKYEQALLQNELRMAQEVQSMLIPKQWPQRKNLDVSSIYLPKWDIGGDYVDCIEIDSNRVAFCIADVSGKGISAAIIMANFQALLRQNLKSFTTLEYIIQELNKAVVQLTNGGRIITFFICEVNYKTRRLDYINAGHVPPMLLMNHEIILLDQGCPILGAVDILPSTAVHSIDLTNPSMLLLYTDGITDMVDQEGHYYEDGQFRAFFKDHAYLDAKSFNDVFLNELKRFNADKEFPDDIAVLTCKIQD